MTKDELVYRKNKGEVLAHLIPVEDNVFDIPRRLREIDPGYFVMFNPAMQSYELHHEEQDTTYCLTFPYDNLDSRAIDFTRETRIERIGDIRQKVHEQNLKAEIDGNTEFNDAVDYMSREIHRSALRRNEAPDENAFATKWQ